MGRDVTHDARPSIAVAPAHVSGVAMGCWNVLERRVPPSVGFWMGSVVSNGWFRCHLAMDCDQEPLAAYPWAPSPSRLARARTPAEQFARLER